MKIKITNGNLWTYWLQRISLFAMAILLGAAAYPAEDQQIRLPQSNVTVRQFIFSVEEQTDYKFLYDETIAPALNGEVQLSERGQLNELLNMLNTKSQLEFRKAGQTILIRPKSKEARRAKIDGVVFDEEGNPLAGATVKIKGATTGTITDLDGKFSLEVPGSETVLVISYVGFHSKEMAVGNQTNLRITLQGAYQNLEGAVVTALGIRREERSLGYAVSEVSGKDFERGGQDNMLKSLAGRVPGVSINSTGGPGSSVSMIIRGITSLSGDNQPLFVVDGVPVINSLNNISQIGNDNKVDYGNAMSDINPEDIESVSVLKGPSAAALYGSRAGNGVVLITTKSGKNVDKVTVSVSSNTLVEVPYKYLPMHSRFATGVRPYTPDNNPYPGGVLTIEEGSSAGAGPELDRGYEAIQWNSPRDENGNLIPLPLVSNPDNVANFVRNGVTTTNGVSVSNNTEKMNYRIGYTNLNNWGIVPNSDFNRNNLSINSDLAITDKLRLSSSVNISRTGSDNRPAGNRGANPLEWAYKLSPHIDINDLKDYWMPGQEGIQQRSQAIGDYNNPYFLAYEVNNSFDRNRVFGNIGLNYQITDEFSLQGKYMLDMYSERRESKIPMSYTEDPNGGYGIVNLDRYERNIEVMATYQKELTDFSMTYSAGGNLRYNRGNTMQNATKSEGSGLIVPGVYTLSNTLSDNLVYSSSISEKAVYSVYGLANLGYKDLLYLDLTARNDWSSTLPAANRSYFYPSASLSAIISDMLPMGNQVDMIKLRAGWAQVGNDTGPYNLLPTLSNTEEWAGQTRLSVPDGLKTPDLKPEIATSYEFGLEAAAFRNRLRFDITYFNTDNKNQILPVTLPPSSGFTSKYVNAGLVNSKGWEMVLGLTPIDNEFVLDLNFNVSKYRSTIEELTDEVEVFYLWSDSRGGAWSYVGDEIGSIYDRKLVTVEDPESPYYGYPVLDEDGSWQAINQANAKNKVGNFNPDFIAGMQASLSYKNWSLSLTFDWRKGGDFVSQTFRYSESDLKTQRFLDEIISPNGLSGRALRDWLVANKDTHITDGINIVGGPTAESGGFPFEYAVTLNDGVFNPGVIPVYNDAGEITGYQENLGEEGTKIIPYADNYPWDFFKPAMFDASYIKLRDATLNYSIPTETAKKLNMQSINIGLYTSNLILWTKAKIGIDPENAFQPESDGTFKQGIERYNVNPWVIPIGFRLNAKF
ncbi:SusC/RagA family TonB-linked outer membrane protein [Echinicola vietnamensis]|uniref:TonB-linked outer membrane protein, SusC/RagA family n=1 Tax=Echinicola vietnamensis (strain DSM 17526 / LMG 23754 / KMM 6221) TaxID=926556 RepID=L0G2W1_ECHVK|nr:SusC/RagA family TonB-linked outer membrane protein [Echinicola vietnamensis]AGA79643.1 TonB-linked outer membrane protein, SusC/RagA family [Echinicola vietnamensis DSM 17526]